MRSYLVWLGVASSPLLAAATDDTRALAATKIDDDVLEAEITSAQTIIGEGGEVDKTALLKEEKELVGTEKPFCTWAHGLTKDKQCNTSYLMDCPSFENANVNGKDVCPPACPFLSRDPHFSCAVSCTTAAKCREQNPQNMFGNPKNNICEECDITACTSCNRGPGTCDDCANKFTLVTGTPASGNIPAVPDYCYYGGNSTTFWGRVIYTILLTIVAVLLTWIIKVICKSPNPEFDKLFKIGLAHRTKCYCRDQSKPGSPMYPITTNVHKENLMGVGKFSLNTSLTILDNLDADAILH